MSVDNSELLMLLGGKKSKSIIGIAGHKGFGVGVYGGDPADLIAMGLTPMDGCDDPSSDNYGNYVHTNGSIMCFIPAFCYRIGNPAAPSYARDNNDALEIRDASEGGGDGWILHRAFVDGGVQKAGFFIDKYIASKDKTGKLVVSVKYGDNISLSLGNVGSSTMSNCSGRLYDAITLGRARGEHYSCVTAFQWSAISMLSLAHGQAATSNQFCGWYDASHMKNYPKGNNTYTLKDFDDSSVRWSAHHSEEYIGKTGSGRPFNKTTHNGQNCGVTDVNGSQWQVVIGREGLKGSQVMFMKESVKAHNITNNNHYDVALYDVRGIAYSAGDHEWGSGALYIDESSLSRAKCGIHPKDGYQDASVLFGYDMATVDYQSEKAIVVGGSYTNGNRAGVWARSAIGWSVSSSACSFRISGYAN